jgi:predicted MFS family arabinose efflux permease
VSLGVLGLAGNFAWALLATFGCGVSWMIVMAVFNVRSQTAAPAEVRARSIAVFMLTFQGAMALGSGFWGFTAGRWGVRVALLAAAAVTVLSLAAASRWRLSHAVEEPQTGPAVVGS